MDVKVGYLIRFRAPLKPESTETAESFGKVTEVRENGKAGIRYVVDVKGPNFWDVDSLYLNKASVIEVLRRPII